MGYATHFTLKVDLLIGGTVTELKDSYPLQAVISELLEQNEEAAYVLNVDGSSEEAGKWYEHQHDMLAFSARHSNILFTLHGEGEESDDIWNEYYLNGKVQVAKAQIQIAPFSMAALK